MKRIGDEYDTELIYDEKNNVLVGSRFYNRDEKRDVVFEWEVIQKLSKEMYFLPTILDYQFKGSAVEYAIKPINGMIPLEYVVKDISENPTELQIKKMFFIRNALLKVWKGMINNFCLNNNVVINTHDFWNGTVIDNKQSLYYLNAHLMEVTKITSDNVCTFLTRVEVDSFDIDIINRYENDILFAFQFTKKINELKKRTELEKKQLTYLIEKKNKQLRNSINKDTIIANMGKTKYNFYFGDSDG